MSESSTHVELPIVWRDSSDREQYEQARVGRVFNFRRPSRYPRAVVEVTSEDDVVKAVKLAKDLQCRVSVRSGGHSWAAWSVRDDAILLDFGKWQVISLNDSEKTVAVSPSTTGRKLNEFLSKHGYLFPGGHCPDVGLGGFLLQGGMGWNCKNWGWACERIVALDVVTADGERLRVDENENPDLYFAARGAGPGFPAIVTKFHLKVERQYQGMLASTFVYPIDRYTEVMDWVIKISPDFDPGTEIVACANTPPQLGQVCINCNFLSFKATKEESEKALELANRTRPEGFLVEVVNEETSLAKEYAQQDIANPSGHRYCSENGYVKNDADVAAVLKPAFCTLPHPKAFAIWFAMAPCSRRTLPDMALSMQTDHYFAMYTVWDDAKDDERCQSWTREVMRTIAPHCEGAYLGDSDFQVRTTKFWTDDKAQRLMQIRRERDPAGRICGYLDQGDKSGSQGLENVDAWFR
ncbi:hypothetical protein DV735_g70, partial [Chaetothyriales sp. CBS 134920]